MTAILCEYMCGLDSGLEEALPRTRWGRGAAWLLPVPVNGSSGGFQKLFSFPAHGRRKKKSILSTYLSSNCFSVTGQAIPPSHYRKPVQIGEEKSVKCDVIKIPCKNQ